MIIEFYFGNGQSIFKNGGHLRNIYYFHTLMKKKFQFVNFIIKKGLIKYVYVYAKKDV